MRFFLFMLLAFGCAGAESWKPEIIFRNGTDGRKLEKMTVRFLSLDNGMQETAKFENVDSGFKFPEIQISESAPVLIQTVYKNATYNKMVPPVPAMRNRPQEITVYESSSDFSHVTVQSVLNAVREDDGVRIMKIYFLNNISSPKSAWYDPEGFEVYIPENAEEIQAQMTQGGGQMPIPLSLSDGKNGKKIQRAILPGESDIQISFLIRGKESVLFKDRLTFDRSREKVILYRPKSMNLEFSGVKAEKITDEAPMNAAAYKLEAEKDSMYEIRFSGGEPVKTGAPKGRILRNGSIFTDISKSLYGVLFIFFFLLAVKYGINIFQRKTDKGGTG